MNTAVLRSVIALVAAAALAWLVAHLVQARRVYREGPVVIGAITGFDTVRSTSKDRRGQRSSSITRYPVVRYAIPPQWPEQAGKMVDYRFTAVEPSNRHLAVGAEVQLRLSGRDPRDATVNSLLGLWLVPLFVLFFGSALLLMPTLTVPTPKKPPREPAAAGRRKGRLSAAATPRGRIGGVVVLLIMAGFFLYPPSMLLVLGPLFLVISVLAVAGALLGVLRRLGRLLLLRPADPAQDRPGVLGLLVDVQQNLVLMLVMGGFLVGSLLAIFVGVDRFAPRQAWSLGPLNVVRTALWLPQDFDEALCHAAAAGDPAGTDWLLAHGARVDVFCGNGAALPLLRSSVPGSAGLAPAHLSRSLLDAARAGNLDAVRDLLDRGADPDSAVAGEAPPLQFAVLNHEDALVDVLLDAGADPDLLLGSGLTITEDLARLDRADKALLYLRRMAAHGASLDRRDAQGRTILMRECADPRTGTAEFVDLVLKLGAAPNLRAADGRTALDMARASGVDEVVTPLLASGARSGRLDAAAPGAYALDEDAPPALAARRLLQQLREQVPEQWVPDAAGQGFSAYAADALRQALPRVDVVVDGYATADRASVTVCGAGGSEGPSCIGMELRGVPLEATAERPASGDPAALLWQVISYWRDRSGALQSQIRAVDGNTGLGAIQALRSGRVHLLVDASLADVLPPSPARVSAMTSPQRPPRPPAACGWPAVS